MEQAARRLAAFFMAENTVTVKCPQCNSFLLRTKACEETEVNCVDVKCKATFIVTVREGRISINEIKRPVPKLTIRQA